MPVLGDGKNPIVVTVEDPHALTLSHGEFFVATRRVVADCGHPQISRSVFCGASENLTFEGAVIGSIARLVVVRLVSRRLRGAASSGRAAASAALLRVRGAALGSTVWVVGRGRLVWTDWIRTSGTATLVGRLESWSAFLG